MKQILFLLVSFAMVMILSCSKRAEVNSVDLHKTWKFKTGDDTAWASAQFDDSKWDTITPGKAWEELGHKGYDRSESVV